MKCSYALFIWVCFLITVSLSTQVQSFITTKEKVLVTISNRTTTATTKSGNANKKTVQHASPLDQFAPAAAVLFGNMITPASILGGAIIPISFASGLNFNGDKNESKFSTFLRKMFPFVSVTSLASFIISVLWATMTVNQITENQPAMTTSVWALLNGPYKLPWAAVNSHLVLGMLGYLWLIATKAYFMSDKQPEIFGLAMSGLMFMLSIVNRCVAAGGGTQVDRYGANIFGLLSTYVSLLFKSATRDSLRLHVLELVAAVLFIVSTISYSKFVINQLQN